MNGFTPELKHHILTQYRPFDHSRSFAALSERYAVKRGRQAVQRWHEKWNGTVASLRRKPGSGRPRTLSSREVNNYIRTPIRNKRRAHAAVHYRDLLPALQQKTGRRISLRTLQRYGKQEVQAKQKRSKKRTADESEYTHYG
jgi:transposase